MNHPGQLHHLNAFWTIVPIVPPTDNDVAAARRMAMLAKVLALEFKFDVHALPSFGGYLLHGLAVGKPV